MAAAASQRGPTPLPQQRSIAAQTSVAADAKCGHFDWFPAAAPPCAGAVPGVLCQRADGSPCRSARRRPPSPRPSRSQVSEVFASQIERIRAAEAPAGKCSARGVESAEAPISATDTSMRSHQLLSNETAGQHTNVTVQVLSQGNSASPERADRQGGSPQGKPRLHSPAHAWLPAHLLRVPLAVETPHTSSRCNTGWLGSARMHPPCVLPGSSPRVV